MLLAVGGTELTRLKNELNLRTDRHDLEALVFDDNDDDAIRQEILDHIAREAQVVGQLDERKVLCDIDDTVKSAIHDDRWPRGTVYPGILALLEALDVGPADEPFSRGDLTFVTARPTDVFGLMERTSHEALTKAGISARTVLTGSFFALRTHAAMAGKKLANINDYRLLFPEYVEELEDLSPAHIFQRRIHGAGYSYRQCFDSGVLNFRQYDAALSELL
mgnify:CR=1 FL=1